MKKSILAVTLAATLTGISGQVLAGDLADKVFTNGDFETMNEAQPNAEVMAVKDGVIVYIGDAKGAKKYIKDADSIVDLEGKYVTPGFIESHNHIVGSTWMAEGVDLSMAKTPDDIGRILKEYADAHPEEKVIIGNGWLYSVLDRKPTTADLDKWGIDRPVVAVGNYCHDAVFNSLAFEVAGIDIQTDPNRQDGVIYWDEDENGKRTGLGIEGQWAQTYVDMGAWIPEVRIPEASEYLQGYLATKGVTTGITAGIMTPPAIISGEAVLKEFRLAADILQKRVENGEAKMRVGIMPIFKLPDSDPQKYVDTAVEIGKKYDSDMLWVAGIKLHSEVAWQEGAATQFVPYLKPNKDGSENFGYYGVPPEVSFSLITKANKAGYNVITHVSGARNVSRLIDIYLESRELYPNARNRFEHFDFASKKDQDRVVENNIPINATTGFANETDAGAGGEALFAVVDKKYAMETYGSYSDMAHRYDNVSISGDSPGFPIEKAHPIWSMQAAMTLIAPDQPDGKPFPSWRKPMTFDQALKAHTTIPAWQMGIEDHVGSLEVGKKADMAIFETSLREIKPEDFMEKANPVGTVLGGEFTHRDGM